MLNSKTSYPVVQPASNTRTNSEETMIPHKISSEVWSKVGTDLFTLRNKDYLIVADYNTKFFEISELPNTLASTVIAHTKNIFARFGIPKSVISDNGPQFTSQEYKLFSQQWDFAHTTSSPEFPQSNGFIERTIQTVKHSLTKALSSEEDPYLALLALRTTPGKDKLSPARRLMGRTPRTTVPSVKCPLKSSKPEQIPRKTITQYNSHARNLPELHPGDKVLLRGDGKWSKKGEVMKRNQHPRSYHVKTDSGNVLRRNRRHLLKIKQPQSQPTPPSSNNQSNHPQQPDSSPEQVLPTPSYITRSGRAIKPPQYLYNIVS